jgi:serine/threonine-protein kinase RsbW
VYHIIQDNFRLVGSFSSILEHVDKFCDQARPLHTVLGRDDVSFAIELLLREMLNNAILHGNKANPKLIVTCSIIVYENTIAVEVADEGQGFDWKTYYAELAKRTDVVGDDGFLPTSGYGLLLLKEYATTFFYNNQGNQVSLTINLSS